MRKPGFGDSDQVRHKSGCAATEDSVRLETFKEARMHCLCGKYEDADQLRCYHAADMRL